MANPSAQTWCSDTLHSLLGCSDSALASYLTSIASTASSHRKILSILKEGDVNPIQATNGIDKERILDKFARDLFHKCNNNKRGGSTSSAGTSARTSGNRKSSSSNEIDKKKKKSNADWIKSAAAYDLIDNDGDEYGYGNNNYNATKVEGDASIAIVSKASASTASSKPLHEIKIKQKDKRKKKSKTYNDNYDDEVNYDDYDNGNNKSSKSSKRRNKHDEKDMKRKSREDKKRRRRRTKLSSSSSDEDDGHRDSVDVRRKYENEVEQRRINRDRKKRTRSYSYSDGEDNSDKEEPGYDEIVVDDGDGDDLTPEQRAEKEREQDLKERDEFAKRLLEKDGRRNDPKNADDSNEKSEKMKKRVEMEQRLARGEEVVDEATGSTITLKSLREESRRAYLKQRTERELKLLEQELQDEEEMFDEDKLTEKEKKRIELRRQILQMARQDKGKKDQGEDDGFYRLPDEYEEQEGRTKAEKDNALLKSRYVEEKVEKTEQQLWEESQVQKAMVGGHRTKRGKLNDQKQYDLVFDDQIDFVMTDERKGYDQRKKKGKRSKRRNRSDESDASMSSQSEGQSEIVETKPLTAHEKILIGRKKLPVYPYREEFLSAVRDQKVLILVGEVSRSNMHTYMKYMYIYI